MTSPPAPDAPATAAGGPESAPDLRPEFGPDFDEDYSVLSRRGRVAAGALLVVLLAGFALARSLTPSEAGMGTHRQLGLPECTVKALTGTPCPACGMTTSFAHFTRGQWGGSAAANSGGFLLAVFCLALLPVLAWAAVSGRLALPRLRGEGAVRPEWWGVLGLSTVGAVTMIDWFFRLAE